MTLIKLIKPVNTIRIHNINIQCFYYANRNIFQKYQMSKNNVTFIETIKNETEMINILEQYQIPIENCKFFKNQEFYSTYDLYHGKYDKL